MPLFHVKLTYEGVVLARDENEAEDVAIEYFDQIQDAQEYPFIDTDALNDLDKKIFANDPVFGVDDCPTVDTYLKREKIEHVE